MISLLKYLKPYRVAVTLAMVMLILSTAADPATPTLVQRIIDIGIAQKDTQFVLNTTLIMVAVTLTSTVLSISYNGEGEEAVLHNISFVTRGGEKIAILGATGAGKSTLVYLIPRYYDVKREYRLW